MSDERLCLLSVHAHPDDESSKGAPSVARYHDAGVHTVLVCCTGGEEGDILNPAMENEAVRANLPAIRMQELEKAAEIIGYDVVELLGYRDSGMPGTPANEDPRSFAQADADEAVERLVSLIRKHRPNVVITYGDDQDAYPHADHLRVHDITVAAFAASGDFGAYPESGSPWQPQKLYYSLWSHARMVKIKEAIVANGFEWPFDDPQVYPNNDHRITTQLDVSDWVHVRREALLAHATQIDPNSPLWFGFTPEVELELNGEEDYVLAVSTVETTLPEVDLFAGIARQKGRELS